MQICAWASGGRGAELLGVRDAVVAVVIVVLVWRFVEDLCLNVMELEERRLSWSKKNGKNLCVPPSADDNSKQRLL